MNPVGTVAKVLPYLPDFLCAPFLGGPIILYTPGEIDAKRASGVISPVNSEAHLPRIHGLPYECHH
jgi:hypothetical protein